MNTNISKTSTFFHPLSHSMIAALLSIILLSIGFSLPVNAMDIGGVTLEDQMNISGAPASLNGAGIRNKFFVDLYAAGLYLANSSSNANEIMTADQNMAIRLHIISKMITSKRMEGAVREGFENSLKGNTSSLEKQIESFIAVFQEEIKLDDVYDMVYEKGKGTHIYKNGTLASTIPGMEFKTALFGIWLGDKPAQEKLKESMLGSL